MRPGRRCCPPLRSEESRQRSECCERRIEDSKGNQGLSVWDSRKGASNRSGRNRGAEMVDSGPRGNQGSAGAGQTGCSAVLTVSL